jgi:hypothetical protein
MIAPKYGALRKVGLDAAVTQYNLTRLSISTGTLREVMIPPYVIA